MYRTMRPNGFTLLEVLVAIFIFAIIAVIMMSGLHIVLNSQSVTEKKSAQWAQLQTALVIISRDFEQTIDRPIINAKNITEAALLGKGREITLTRAGFINPGAVLPRSTLQRVHYFLQKDHLIRETWGPLDPSAKTVSDKRILLTDVADFHFEYLGTRGQFTTLWPLPDQPDATLPKGIRIVIDLSHAGKLSQLYLLPNAALESKDIDDAH